MVTTPDPICAIFFLAFPSSFCKVLQDKNESEPLTASVFARIHSSTIEVDFFRSNFVLLDCSAQASPLLFEMYNT